MASLRGIAISPEEVETNLVFFELTPEAAMTAPTFVEKLLRTGVGMEAMGKTRARAVTHLDVSQQDIEATLKAVHKLFHA